MQLINDIKMPPRKSIKKELLKVSNFTEEEVEVMYWSSLYKAYSLIVRYEQKGIEDEFRSKDWFKKALKHGVDKKEIGFNYKQFIKESK